MPVKIIYSPEILKEIKDLYESGLGVCEIAKKLNFGRHTITKLFKELGIFKNRFHSEEFYSQFWLEDDKWWGYWECNECKEQIKFGVSEKCLLNRELKKKNICKKCSLKKQVGEGNPFYGKKHTDAAKKSNSEKKKGIRTSNHMSTPEYKKLFSDLLRKKWASGTMEHVRAKMSAFLKARIVNGDFKGYIRSKAEDELIKILKENGIEVNPNHKIETKTFDLFIPTFNLLIEYNGDYWHCNPEKYSATFVNKKKNMTAQELWNYDAKKICLGKEHGYYCEVIWESDYKKNKNIILEIIEKYAKK